MPGPLTQSTLSGKVIKKKVHNPYKKTPNKETNSAVTSTATAATTAVTTCIANNAEEEEMIQSSIKYNHMKGVTTNSGYRSAIKWYDIYKATDANLTAQYPSLDDLTPPRSAAEHDEFCGIMKGFADYLVVHARKAGTDVHLDPGTGIGYFRNVLGYLKSISVWTTWSTPKWHPETAKNIETRLTEIKATNGGISGTKRSKETKITRKIFKNIIFESFRKASSSTQARTWSMW